MIDRSVSEMNSLEAYPIKAVVVLKGGLILIKEPLLKAKIQNYGKRKPVMALSRRSLGKLALVALSTSTQYSSLLTLTYGQNYPTDGREVKRHIKRVIYWLGRKGMKDYLWFVEFQKRGAPHIHILTDFEKLGIETNRSDLALYWAQLVEPYGWLYCRVHYDRRRNCFLSTTSTFNDTQTSVYRVHSHPSSWELLRSRDGAGRYVTKYATKTIQKEVPAGYTNMGRFWGAPQKSSLKNLVKTWIYTDEEGAYQMTQIMKRDFSTWSELPKIILGNTDELLTMLSDSV